MRVPKPIIDEVVLRTLSEGGKVLFAFKSNTSIVQWMSTWAPVLLEAGFEWRAAERTFIIGPGRLKLQVIEDIRDVTKVRGIDWDNITVDGRVDWDVVESLQLVLRRGEVKRG